MPFRGLSALMADLAASRRRATGAAAAYDAPHRGRPIGGGLVELKDFGTNPGRLRMYLHMPACLAPQPGLVVVLHGCTQTAAGYDLGAGWSTLADRYGFALLLPEQTRLNNPRLCFNWFRASDTGRDRGEAASIRQGVARVLIDHPALDRGRVFVTGLSAGGAMASVMLATYPEVFAAGAIIAGLPFGCADGMQQAFDAMKSGRTPPGAGMGRPGARRLPPPRAVAAGVGLARRRRHRGGAAQRRRDHQAVDRPPRPAGNAGRGRPPRRPSRAASGAAQTGEIAVEEILVAGMAHGTPLAIKGVDDPYGAAGPFLLDVGIASSFHIARFFGLIGPRVAQRPEPGGAGSAPGPKRPGGLPDILGAISRTLRTVGSQRR